MSDKAVFDVSRRINIRLQTPDGAKIVPVRFPTDPEWTERFRRRKVIIKDLGRGVQETSVPNAEEADAALLAKIREEGAPDVDPFEAIRIVEQLSEAVVDDVAPEGAGFRVSLRVPGGITSHLVRVPTARECFEYRRSFARILDLPYGRQQLSINLAAAGSLYERIGISHEGYAGAVPVIHQSAAVKAAIDAMEAGMRDDLDPNS